MDNKEAQQPQSKVFTLDNKYIVTITINNEAELIVLHTYDIDANRKSKDNFWVKLGEISLSDLHNSDAKEFLVGHDASYWIKPDKTMLNDIMLAAQSANDAPKKEDNLGSRNTAHLETGNETDFATKPQDSEEWEETLGLLHDDGYFEEHTLRRMVGFIRRLLQEQHEDDWAATRLLWDRMHEWQKEYKLAHPQEKIAYQDALKLIEWKLEERQKRIDAALDVTTASDLPNYNDTNYFTVGDAIEGMQLLLENVINT